MTREKVLIAGAGIAGLGAALALGDGTRDVTILDRDPPPPDTSPEEAFTSWERRGATQLRHSHAFLGRLTTLIRTRYPALMDELLKEGARLIGYEEMLPPSLMPFYRRQEGDYDLAFLLSRRSTLELVIRRYAARLPGVTFIADAGVHGLLTHREGNELIADGLKVDRGGTIEDMRADIIVDASGRNTSFPDWLRAEHVEITEEESPAGILYFTRHYRLRDGAEEPPRDGTPGAADLGYIKFGVFNADNRHFSITLAVPEIETALRTAVMKPEIFDAACTMMPAAARWIDPARAEAVTPVFGMGNLKSVWRSYLKDGEPQVLNFFAIGDAAVRTNPLYGRGCSTGVVHAHILRDTLNATTDPRERARMIERDTFTALRPFYDSMVQQDEQSIRRALNEQNPNYKPRLKARIVKSFAEDALIPATRADLAVSRATSRAFHMIGHPTAWLKSPAILARIVRLWVMPRRMKERAGYYRDAGGPERSEMLSRLGLAA
jgi:2-polyprenyl-6-methoxyphenol hydroxylase-like FAD-dependent oxidoreductase